MIGSGALQRRAQRSGPAPDVEDPAAGRIQESLDVRARVVAVGPGHRRATAKAKSSRSARAEYARISEYAWARGPPSMRIE